MWFSSFILVIDAMASSLRGREKNQMPDGKDRLLRAAELLDLSEHLICTLGTCDRGMVVRFAMTELQALAEAVALLNISTPYQQAPRRTTAAVDSMKPAIWDWRRW